MTARPRRRPSRLGRPRRAPVALVALAAVAVASVWTTACGVGPESAPTVLGVDVEGALVLPGTGDERPDAATTVAVYLVRDEQLVRVTRDLPAGSGPAAVVQSLLAGPTGTEARAGVATAIPSSTVVSEISVDDGRATVDLSEEFTTVGGIEEVLAVGQVVLTLTDASDVNAVVFALDGVATVVPTGDGALTARAVTAADYAQLLG